MVSFLVTFFQTKIRPEKVGVIQVLEKTLEQEKAISYYLKRAIPFSGGVKMKAVIVDKFGPAEVMKLVEIPQKEPGIGQVVVRVEAIGVNPVDTYIRSGLYPVLPALPYTPGLDASGTIAKLGEGVNQWAVGDRVYTAGTLSGTYAEFALCDATAVYRLPEDIDFNEGAAIGVPGSTAWRALFHRGRAKAAEKVLIHGASGSVGLFAIQLARIAGLNVTGTAGSEEGRVLVRKMGADRVLNHKNENYQADLFSATDNQGFELILEMLADVNLEKDLELLAPRGRIVVVGSRGRIEIDPRLTIGKETDIRGVGLFNATREELTEIHAALFGALTTGGLHPVVGKEMPLAKVRDAHQQVLASGNLGKIILHP